MPRKKKVEKKELDLPEFGYFVKDDSGAVLVLQSNHGKDMGKYLEEAKKLDRPILIQIEGDMFDRYKFTNFSLTKDEALNLSRELIRMVEHLEK